MSLLLASWTTDHTSLAFRVVEAQIFLLAVCVIALVFTKASR